MSKPANARYIRRGDLLIPKRGRYLDPVIVVEVRRPDHRAVIKDAAICSKDPKWNGGKGFADRDGTEVKTFRELTKDYTIACPDDRMPYDEWLHIIWKNGVWDASVLNV